MLDLKTEKEYFARGYKFIAGVDEAGRGPLAGPVVAAAVVIGADFEIGDDDLTLVADSKKLSAKRREELFGIIKSRVLAVEIGLADNQTIDKINILQASFLAMRRALRKLPVAPDYILTDGKFMIPKLDKPQSAIISGDAKVWAIAAASIIAKVSRDWLMSELDKKYPAYEFARHKGYGTKLHLEKIAEHGPCPIHRYSFAPIKGMAERDPNG
ncbi:MAG: ribonuclease HII [Patescibacteria group bacterium]